MREREGNPQPKSPLEERYSTLPVKVLQYLYLGKSSRDPLIGEDSRAALRERQAETMGRFSDGDLKAMCDFITWRNEYLNPDPKINPVPSIRHRDLGDETRRPT